MSDGKIVLDGQKLAYHLDRVEALCRGERVAPITIDMALTRACTYKCVYCYGQLQENERMPLTKEILLKFLDDATEIGVKAISLVSDGESTCSPHFYDFILYGKGKGLDMAVGTNGHLLKDDRLEEILPALTYLRFNISAGESERYAEIHGCTEEAFYKVYNTIKKCVEIKREKNLDVTIGIQMVFLPSFSDQVLPLAKLGEELKVDYFVIKHCSDDEDSSLGVDYSKYYEQTDLLKEAETYSTDDYLVKVKWSKILSGGKRKYSKCYGPPLIMQLSGSGLVAPCGPLFNDKYKKYHIGNIVEKRFKDIWKSERHKEVMDIIASDEFNPQTDCGTLCLQHKVNECLWDLKQGEIRIEKTKLRGQPLHVNFI